MEKQTTIEFKNKHGEYKISVNKDEMTIGEVFEDLIEPVLLAAQYRQEQIDDYLDNEVTNSESHKNNVILKVLAKRETHTETLRILGVQGTEDGLIVTVEG
jgi:hypothetical protein